MNDFYTDTSQDYLIQHPNGTFYAMKKIRSSENDSWTHFVKDPHEACCLFKDDAQELVDTFNKDPRMPEFVNCKLVKRDETLEKYDEPLTKI